MNPVIPIVANRTAQSFVMAATFQTVYRSLLGKNPAPLLTLGVNTLITSWLCFDLTRTFYGPCRIGYPEIVTALPTGSKQVALTFDDGPSEVTPKLLDLLDVLDVRATFFLVGENVAKYPQYLEQIIRGGHGIASHGYHHDAMALKSEQFIRQEIRRTKEVLGTQALPYFRPPFGFKSHRMVNACRKEGVRLTTWSVNPKDYSRLGAEQLACAAALSIRDGSIILLHEWSEATLAALPSIIHQIRFQGYQPITLPSTPA